MTRNLHADWQTPPEPGPDCPRCKALGHKSREMHFDGEEFACQDCRFRIVGLPPGDIEALTANDLIDMEALDPLDLEDAHD